MSSVVEEEVTLEDIATMCEENQEELADLILQQVPFYSFIKTEPVSELDTTMDAQVTPFLECDMTMTDLTDIAHEETCCSNDCYTAETGRSPGSEGSMSYLSPHGRKKCSNSRKNRTPNTLQYMMEKHRHSERKRHHSLNERLKAICQLIPDSTMDNRETKVVMMQRVISYIAYLENSIKVLCCQMGSRPHPSWVLLTTNFAAYFHDYFKGIEDTDAADDAEVFSATQNLSRSLKDPGEESYTSSHPKVSSPTVDSTTDSVVPVMVPPAEEEVVVLSQDSGVPSSSLAGEEDQMEELWAVCEASQEFGAIGSAHGDAEVFFRSSVDEGVSAVLEISSSTSDDKPLTLGLGEDYKQDADHTKPAADTPDPCPPKLKTSLHPSPVEKNIHNLYTLQKSVPDTAQRRNKRKQLSPRRSASQDDYLSDKAYLPSWPSGAWKSSLKDSDTDRSSSKVRRVLPYNIRCNHRHPVQRLQATGAKLGFSPSLAVLNVPCPSQDPHPQEPEREPEAKTQEKVSTKLDLRKTSWMNGFMMFSRLNRRNFIQAHPGVHTSHISKIMGHTWRNMSKEDQAPYREKAQLCAKALYRVYSSQPQFSQSSDAAATTTTTTDSTADTTSPTPGLFFSKESESTTTE